jgi:cytochrome c553
MNRASIGVLAFGLSWAMHAAAATPQPSKPVDPKATGPQIAEQVCSGCHGASGMSTVVNVPNLAGQSAQYLAKQLREFKTRKRSDAGGVENMWSISHKLTEKQIDQLAKHFSGQAPQPQAAEGTPEQVAAGKTIFTGGALAHGVPPCSGCHGADGAGKTMFPRLAGQHMTYLVKQLMVFQTTEERPGGSVMKSVSHELSPQDVENVAAYLQALPREAAR